MTTTIRLSAQIDHAIGSRRGGSVRHILIALEADATNVGSAPLDLAIALDVSGSMEGEKIETARRAALAIVEALGDDDHLALSTFSGRGELRLPRTPMTREGRARAAEALRAVRASGGTNLSEGWLLAVEALATALRPEAVTRAILLSDGQANAGITEVAQLARHASALRERAISTTAVGIGHGYDSELLQQIASHGGGQLHDAERGMELHEVLQGELSELRGIAARDASVQIQVPHGVRVEVLGDLPTHHRRGVTEVAMGSLGAGARRDVCLRLFLPPAGAPELPLTFAVSAVATPAEGGPPIVATASCAFTFGDAAVRAATPRDLAVVARVATLWHASLVQQAMSLNRARRGRELRELIEAVLPRFERYVQDLPGFFVRIEELRELAHQADRLWNEQTRKAAEVEMWKSTRSSVDHRTMRRAWNTENL